MAWAGPYHSFGYIISFFFFFLVFQIWLSCSEPWNALLRTQCPHAFPHWLVLSEKGLILSQWHTFGDCWEHRVRNCFDGNCFLNWSAVGKTAEKELFWIALLVKNKKKKKTVLAFHQFLPFEAICYSLQVLVLRKRNTVTFSVFTSSTYCGQVS